ncbi:universal stress protein [Lentilactobacillus senioris]|uniref:universal stress protein n=1 Tax=Lentilactobacillus senioris TaxID=931534 RepID=UPI00227E3541|nr:universal stress protein [Lentilactobacillus senioris]MCY9806219.1 universal stress protein [Lentilactobacillus senioris]
MAQKQEPNKNFKRILVGVDDSEDAQLAFRYAIREARQNDATLIITSILEDDDMSVYQALDKNFVKDQRQKLYDHVNEYRKLALRAGVKNVDIIISEGQAGETIVKKVIPAAEADLLVIGSLSKTGIRKYFGSQASYMAKYAPISVMVVR